ncbi:thioesterase family protein [Pseudomonas sp. SIMBA_059]|uniref:acyl-CoA thioesterase n=1 Tax=Pseudomonas palleroniana TaxID=191390 RepID=UPI001E3FAB30|nr:thioesterase family protein [Pseudomonas palleroniana]
MSTDTASARVAPSATEQTPMPVHIYQCPVRWSDMDVYGVVNNVSFLRLLEEARVDFIWRLGAEQGDAFFSGGSVVVRHAIEYKRPLVHRHEPVAIHMWVSQVRAAAVTIEYEVRDGDTLCALASTTMAPFNYEGRYPRTMSDEETAFFERFLNPRKALSCAC